MKRIEEKEREEKEEEEESGFTKVRGESLRG